jgi:hypothetical protein
VATDALVSVPTSSIDELVHLIQQAEQPLHASSPDASADTEAPLHETWLQLCCALLQKRTDSDAIVQQILHRSRLTLHEEQQVWQVLDGVTRSSRCLQFKFGLASRFDTIRKQAVATIRQYYHAEHRNLVLCDMELAPQLLSLGLLVDCIGNASFNQSLTRFLRVNTKWSEGTPSFTSVSSARNGLVHQSLAHVVSQLVLARRYYAAASLLMVVYRLHSGFTTRKNGMVLLRTFLETHQASATDNDDNDNDNDETAVIEHDGTDDDEQGYSTTPLSVSAAQCRRACRTAMHMVKGML